MSRSRSRARRAFRASVSIVTLLGCALGLGGCGGFDSAASGEHLIKDYVKRFGAGRVAVKSARCPNGVKQKVGGGYDCSVVLHDKLTGKDHPGTVTVHMVAGNKVEIGGQDLHIR